MSRFIQDPATGKLVPYDEYRKPVRRIHMIMSDIEPYQSMASGEMIGGRAQHREHLRKHGMIEVGNEIAAASTPHEFKPAPGRKEAIADAVSGHGY